MNFFVEVVIAVIELAIELAWKIVSWIFSILGPKKKEIVLTASFIEAGDLEDDCEFIDDIKEATKNLEWDSAKAIMLGQIGENVIRRVLFFEEGSFIGTCGAGRMPIAVNPVKNGAGGFEFSNDQETIASAYRNLVGKDGVEEYDEGSSTWSLTKAGAPILAVTLIPNEEKDASIISKMHQAAYGLFVGRHISGIDILPSLYVSILPNVKGVRRADFGKFLSLQKSHFCPGDRTMLHNYFPGKTDGKYFMLAGRINQ
jgi:hypothetical protein